MTLAALAAVALVAAACGSAKPSAAGASATTSQSSTPPTKVAGRADVAYAGSPNVFESIGAAPITAFEPKLTSWYVQLAASPIVVAYNPRSSFAPQLKAIAEGSKPLSDLFTLMSIPGFTLGWTNPDTDPQGQAFYEMVELAQSRLHLPAGSAHKLLGGLDNPSQVFAETALESRLQAGQLDAASAFLSQAVQLHLPYIALPSSIDFGDPALAAEYAKAKLTSAEGRWSTASRSSWTSPRSGTPTAPPPTRS